jgi:hypothetical protein
MADLYELSAVRAGDASPEYVWSMGVRRVRGRPAEGGMAEKVDRQSGDESEPLINASRRLLASSRGRLDRSQRTVSNTRESVHRIRNVLQRVILILEQRRRRRRR